MRVRSKYLLIMGVVWGPCLALAAASYAMILRPQMDNRRELVTKVGQAKMQYAQALKAAKAENQIRLAEQVDRLKSRVSDFLVGFENAPALAFEIGNLAHEARLESFGIKPANTQGSQTSFAAQHVSEKHLNVSFLGGFTQFAAFLNALERHHPTLFVETFTINRPLESDTKPRVDMNLAVLVEKSREN